MITAIVFYLIFLLGSFVLQISSTAYRVLESTRSKEQLKATDWFHPFRTWLRLFFRSLELETLFFSISCSKHVLRFLLAASAALIAWETRPMPTAAAQGELTYALMWSAVPIWFLLLLVGSLIFGDFFPRALAVRHPEKSLRFATPIAAFYLFCTSPICFLILGLSKGRLATYYIEGVQAGVGQVKEKIMEMIQEAKVQSPLDVDEKRLLEGVADFRNRIVREIMTPRVDIFAVSADMSIRDAAALFAAQGYSRAPAYRESIDRISGVLMYKTLMAVIQECHESGDTHKLDLTVESVLKPAIYVPETSRATHLLRELRDKQSHMAIVVDEYGGTEGLVTIEDCIEEIVGEIADEHDEQEAGVVGNELQGWELDARTSILEIEDRFGIKIPQEGDYDTIGGYAFHCAGEIPAIGLLIYHEDFELEVLKATDRTVEKVKLRKIKKSHNH